MKKLLAFLALLALPITGRAATTVFNPFTGKPDFVGAGTASAGTNGSIQYGNSSVLAGSTYWYLLNSGANLCYDAEHTYAAEDAYLDAPLVIRSDRAIDLDTQGTGGVVGGRISWRSCPFGSLCSDQVQAYWSEQGSFGGGNSVIFADYNGVVMTEFSGTAKRFYAPSAFAIGVTTTALTAGTTISGSGVDTSIQANATSGSFTITLPAQSALASPKQSGRIFFIQKTDTSTNTVKIGYNGANTTTPGAVIATLTQPKETITLQGENIGSNYLYRLLGNYDPSSGVPVSLSTGVTGSLPAASIAAGSLGAAVIPSSFPVTGVTAGSYTNASVTVNAQGMLSAASSGATALTVLNSTFTAVLNSSFTTTLNTNVSVSSMAFSIGANESWSFEFWLLNGCDNTGGNKFALTVPSGATFRAMSIGEAATGTSIRLDRMDTSGTLTGAYNAQTNSNGWVQIFGTVTNGATPGTVQLQAASTTASQTTSLNIGSHLNARKM